MQIFISYAREDLAPAKRLFESLKNIPDATPWLDQENLLPGQDWERGIMVAIEESNFMLSLLSKNSVDKAGVVQKEVHEGLKRYALLPPGRIYLIPARLDDCTPSHSELKKLHWVDLFPDWDEGIRKIEKTIDHERTIEKKVARKTLREVVLIEDYEAAPKYSQKKSRRWDLLRGGNLAGANLMYENLSGLDLSRADLHGANLTAADLSHATLKDANLKGANLERGRLAHSDLEGANLWGVNLWRADLSGVKNLSKAGSLEHTNFYKVRGLSNQDKETIESHKTTSLSDYGSFFRFFRSNVGMSPKRIESIFPWIRTAYFRSILTQII